MLCTFGSLPVRNASNPVDKLFSLVGTRRQKELVQSEMPGVTEHKSFERAGPIAVAAMPGGGKQKASKPQKHETPTPTRIVVKARAAAAPRDDQDQPMETTLLPSAVPALPAGHAEEPPAQNVLRPIISPPGHKGQDRHVPSAQPRGGRARPQARGQQAPRAVRGAHGAAPRLVQRAAQNARVSSEIRQPVNMHSCLKSVLFSRRRCRGHKAK